MAKKRSGKKKSLEKKPKRERSGSVTARLLALPKPDNPFDVLHTHLQGVIWQYLVDKGVLADRDVEAALEATEEPISDWAEEITTAVAEYCGPAIAATVDLDRIRRIVPTLPRQK